MPSKSQRKTTRRKVIGGIAPITEKQFMAQVIQLARLCGWLCYHTHDSRRSQAGYPDLTLVRGDRLLFVELKREAGRTTPEQRQWLESLRAAGQDAHLWRPSDWPSIETALA